MLGDRVAGLAAQNVVEARLRTAFIAQPKEILEWIRNPPPREQIDGYVELVLGGHIRRGAVPLENPLVDRVDVLDEGHLELQPGRSHRFTDGFAELGDDHLLDFVHGIDRARRDVRPEDQNHHDGYDLVHGRAPCWESRFSSGRMPCDCSSTMIVELIAGMTSCRVSI